MKVKVLFILGLLLLLSIPSYAQLGNRFFWCDSIAISTASTDTTWDDAWEQAIILTDSVNVYLKIGAEDVTNWDDRNWFYWPSGVALSIGPRPRLKRLEVKTVTGTGTLYVLGYKKTRQQ